MTPLRPSRARVSGAAALVAAALVFGGASGCRRTPEAPSSVLLPVVADAPGVGGRLWKTALVVDASTADGPVELELSFVDRDGVAHASRLSLAAGGGLRQEDLFGFLRQSATPPLAEGPMVGPLEVRAATGHLPPIRVEIYSLDPVGGGRFAQSYDTGMLRPASAGRAAALALSGIPVRPEFRTNIGVANPTDSEIEVEVRLHDLETGAPTGDAARLRVGPRRLATLSDLAKTLHVPSDSRPVTARISSIDGRGDFLAWASTLDTRTDAPVFVAGQPVP